MKLNKLIDSLVDKKIKQSKSAYNLGKKSVKLKDNLPKKTLKKLSE